MNSGPGEGFCGGRLCIPKVAKRSTSASTRGKSRLAEWTSRNMDDITQLNLRVLRRHNPAIDSLVDSSSYCVVYTFDTVNESWTKAGYEGTLFLYRQEPHVVQTPHGEERGGEYGFCVLNRLSLDNFWGEINGGDIILDGKYIITRSLVGGTSADTEPEGNATEVFGLWLYEELDTPRIYTTLQTLNESARYYQTNAVALKYQEAGTSTPQNIDITTLFAQQQPSSPELRETDPTIHRLPSVDRLSQLFSHALSLQQPSR